MSNPGTQDGWTNDDALTAGPGAGGAPGIPVTQYGRDGWYNGNAVTDGLGSNGGGGLLSDAAPAPSALDRARTTLRIQQFQAPTLDGGMTTVTIDPSILNYDFSQHNPTMNVLNGMGIGNFGAAYANLAANSPNTPQQTSAGNAARGISKALYGGEVAAEGAGAFGRRIAGLAASGSTDALDGMDGVTKVIAAPFIVGQGIADTVGDIQNGASPAVSIVGNAARTGLVFGAGALGELLGPEAAIGAGWAANKYLPPATTIGKTLLDW